MSAGAVVLRGAWPYDICITETENTLLRGDAEEMNTDMQSTHTQHNNAQTHLRGDGEEWTEFGTIAKPIQRAE